MVAGCVVSRSANGITPGRKLRLVRLRQHLKLPLAELWTFKAQLSATSVAY